MGSGSSHTAPQERVPDAPAKEPPTKLMSKRATSQVAEGGTISPEGYKRRRELGLDQRGDEEPPEKEDGDDTPQLTSSTQDSESSQPSLFQSGVISSWMRGAMIGKGAGGVVYEAMDDATGSMFCVKVIEFDENFFESSSGRRRYENLKDEVLLMKTLRHPNIVRFLGLERRQLTMYILMELVPGGSLSSLIKKVGPLPERTAAKFTSQLLQALYFISQQGVVHRDIKGGNILVSVQGQLKLADFGASKRMSDSPEQLRAMAGTPYWMAPEVVRQEGCTPASDVWSLGCTVVEMLTGAPPFSRLPPMQAMFRIGEGKEDPLEGVAAQLPPSSSLKEFLQLCFKSNPLERATPAVLLSHPWIVQLVHPSKLPPLQFGPSRGGAVDWSLTDRPVQGGLQELARLPRGSNAVVVQMPSHEVDSCIRSGSSGVRRSLTQQSSSHRSNSVTTHTHPTTLTTTVPKATPSRAAIRSRTFKAVLDARAVKGK